jgi:hypothetical protein
MTDQQTTEKIAELVANIRARGDRIYCDMVDLSRQPNSLGAEAKLRGGAFGNAELNAHKKCSELLGRHRALYEAALMIELEFGL